ncbi:MAG: hypothetical protein OIF51_08900 [Cellvibrionaceae bacterium]|nr:hypothetical protein [Cellvibrionaceae bacterium]
MDSTNKLDAKFLKRFEIKAVIILIALLSSTGFVFDFLLRAKEYPELSRLMLSTIGLCIGGMSVGASVYLFIMCKVSVDDYKTSLPPPDLEKSLKFNSIRILLFVIGMFFVLAGFVLLDFVWQNFGEDLKAFRIHIDNQIENPNG